MPAPADADALEQAVRRERAAARAWLHDRPLQMLELIAAGGYADDADPAWLRHLAAKAADELRAYIEGEYDRPGPDGLVAALATALADSELLAPDVTHELLLGRVQAELAPDVVRELAAAVGEALTNVRKHAQARRVVVTCEATPEAVRVTVGDDGIGVDPDRITPGLGLRRSLRGRLRRLGGTAELEPRPGGGTRVVLSLEPPVAAPVPLRRTDR